MSCLVETMAFGFGAVQSLCTFLTLFISFDKLILYWKTIVLPKKILSDYSGDKWRPAVACESNKLIG